MKKSYNSSIFTPYFIIVAFLATLTTVSALILSSSSSHAETSSVLASVTVPDVCTIAADNSSTAHTDTVGVGEYKANIGETVFNITCNDNNGYSIYAVGYSNNTEGNTNLIGTTNGATIPTGTSTVTGSSAVSNWAMKLTAVSGTFPATILDSYDSYHVVPSTATKVATRTSSIDLSADSKIKTTYAVSISPAQTADSYVGKVKYTVVHPNNANADGTIRQYMQDLTLAQCQKNVGSNGNPENIGDNITVYDKRDGKDYTVRYINGECWMTQNLRYLGDTNSAAKTMTIGNNNSNVTNASITLYSLDSSDAGNFNAYSDHCDSTNGYNYACVYDSGSTSTGVWYNYYAASGGTISTDSNSTAATSDICPKNWHLPSGPNTESNTDFNKLVGNTTSGWQAATTGLTAYGAVAGGRYYNGSLDSATRGYWWSATAYDTTRRYFLFYNSSNGQFFGNGGNDRYVGYYVRCTRTS